MHRVGGFARRPRRQTGGSPQPLEKKDDFPVGGGRAAREALPPQQFPRGEAPTISKARRPQRSRDGQEPIRASCVGRAAGRPFSPSPCSAGYLGRSRQIRSATPPSFSSGKRQVFLIRRESVRSFSADVPGEGVGT